MGEVTTKHNKGLSDQRMKSIVSKIHSLDSISEAINYCKTVGMSTDYKNMTDSGKFASDILRLFIDQKLKDPNYFK